MRPKTSLSKRSCDTLDEKRSRCAIEQAQEGLKVAAKSTNLDDGIAIILARFKLASSVNKRTFVDQGKKRTFKAVQVSRGSLQFLCHRWQVRKEMDEAQNRHNLKV